MVVTVAGNFDERRARGLVTEAFAKVPSGSTRPAINLVVPEQTNQRVDHIGSAACGAPSAMPPSAGPLAATTASASPFFLYGWLVAPAGHDDLAAIRVVMQLLENAAVWRGPARAERLAGFPATARLSASLDERTHASLLLLRVEASTASELDDARKLVDKMLLDLSVYGPDERETLAAWSVVHAWYLAQLADVASRASWLTRAELTGTGAASFARVMQPLAATNRNEIRAAARKYFSPIRRNFVEYAPRTDANSGCDQN